jgi:16S rRNA (cytidine1402-2'-O)-methyltransferase
MNPKSSTGIVYLIPIIIAEETQDIISSQVRDVIKSLDHFAVENIRTARRFISGLKLGLEIENLHFYLLDKKAGHKEINQMMALIKEGNSFGIMSESGSPGIADPGHLLVSAAHRNKIEVIPLPGPSSILLALMGSGFNGQQFRFVGYLPIDQRELTGRVKELENRSARDNETQIFIETPYRNDRLTKVLFSELNAETSLCIAIDITGKNQSTTTKTIREWRLAPPKIGKRPTVFLIYSGNIS